MMLNRAAARLITRLKKNSTLIQREDEEGVNEELARRDEMVEDIVRGIPKWLPCDEIWYAMSWFVMLELVCCRSWYVCTTKVVRIAENNAACTACQPYK